MIVDTPDGWAAFEVKLTGDQDVIDRAAKSLLDFAADVDASKHGSPSALVVVTATGGGGKRTDGVHVVPIFGTRAVAVDAWPTACKNSGGSAELTTFLTTTVTTMGYVNHVA